MRDGYRVFDADAHVVYPADLWNRFLDERFRHRIGRRAPGGVGPRTTRSLSTAAGRQHPTTLYGQFQKGDQLDRPRT